jgi:hypothetical protein
MPFHGADIIEEMAALFVSGEKLGVEIGGRPVQQDIAEIPQNGFRRHAISPTQNPRTLSMHGASGLKAE